MADVLRMVSQLSRQQRRQFYRKHKKELDMSWPIFNTVVNEKRKVLEEQKK